MEINTAVEKARQSEEVKNLRSYFLGSCFAVVKKSTEEINDWTLMYYDPKTHKAIDCFVSEKFVTLSKETRPVNEVGEMDFSELKVGIGKALETAQDKFARGTINILITLHKKDSLIWTINMIGADLSVITYDIDAGTGKVLNEESTTLIRRLDRGDPL